MMKKLTSAFFLLLVCLGVLNSTSVNADEQQIAPDEAEIIALVKELALLTDKADACGEHMNYYGKKALTGAVCKEFKAGFYNKWPSREALQEKILDYVDRLEQGKLVCEGCRAKLQRAEELRITVTYYLDYMDFMNEF